MCVMTVSRPFRSDRTGPILLSVAPGAPKCKKRSSEMSCSPIHHLILRTPPAVPPLHATRSCLFGRAGILGSPFLGRGDSRLLVLLPALGHIGGEGVVGVGGAEQGLDGEKDGADLEGR
jgi:hypothetical protein